MNTALKIRQAGPGDHEAIWEIIREVIATGDTYVFDPASSREKMLAYWCGPDKHCYVAEAEGRIVGSFILKDNQPDLGSHVANASYMVKPGTFGKGIGRAMGEFSLLEARKLGYLSMQFNIVVKENKRAIRLWESLGFEIKAELPEAFRHPAKGLVPALLMWRKL